MCSPGPASQVSPALRGVLRAAPWGDGVGRSVGSIWALPGACPRRRPMWGAALPHGAPCVTASVSPGPPAPVAPRESLAVPWGCHTHPPHQPGPWAVGSQPLSPPRSGHREEDCVGTAGVRGPPKATGPCGLARHRPAHGHCHVEVVALAPDTSTPPAGLCHPPDPQPWGGGTGLHGSTSRLLTADRQCLFKSYSSKT